MNKKEYEEKLECLITQAEIFNKQIEELKNVKIEEDNVWKPKYNEYYWFVDSFGKVYEDRWLCFEGDEFRYSVGNVYKTKEDAEFKVEKLKVITQLKQFSREFIYGYRNFYINLSNGSNLSYKYRSNVKVQGIIYFESEEKIKEAVESVGEDRIKKYLFGIEY